MAGSTHLPTKSPKGRQFRISQPNEEDDDIDDVQRGRSILFLKYRSQSRESAGSSDLSCLSASGVQTGQNALDDSQQYELKGSQAAGKRENRLIQPLKRNDEFFESLIDYINEYKTVCDFDEPDLACKPNEKLIPGASFLHVNQMNLLDPSTRIILYPCKWASRLPILKRNWRDKELHIMQ